MPAEIVVGAVLVLVVVFGTYFALKIPALLIIRLLKIWE